MSRIAYVAREYWFELLIAVLAIAGMLELVVGRDSSGAPATSLWLSVPAVAILVLPLFARRRSPFCRSRRLLVHVQLQVDGEPFPLPRAIDLSAYRIVQEGLANALEHARANHAEVTVRSRREELELEVADDGEGPATATSLGHGLGGIRERVNIYGGKMSAGAAPAGGFLLSARLPVDRYQR